MRTYERCLLHLHKMPRIWLEYVDALAKTGAVTEVRHAFDRALKALPITQHEHVWPAFVAWADDVTTEYEGKMKVLIQVTKYITWLKENDDSSEEDEDED